MRALLLIAAAVLSAAEQSLRRKGIGLLARAQRHTLRICNAYPSGLPLSVATSEGVAVTEDGPLQYQQCDDFRVALKAGNRLDFNVGDQRAGTFTVSDLPSHDAILLLVIYRHDTESTAASFESHVFANLLNAQLAVIDTYKGREKSVLKIEDAPRGESDKHGFETLRFDTVVAVNQGQYGLKLVGEKGKVLAEQQFGALNRESYVILRTGVEDASNKYKASLVVFPKTDILDHAKAGAAFQGGLLALVLAALLR
mmetsp:Transcript_14075/g.31193  ORF Transcript_14075/g.31193 Transcript_14075/m.31193 type:complete len:255 (+) Transcript_14075:73-837(+)